MINSIYTNREIFLRELISNASDAVDKLYFKSLTDSSITVAKDDLFITVSFDKDARTITVEDSGIGMTKAELEENLGTIAHSGSQEFKTENAEDQGKDLDIIGRFGVGFYSAFMVAQKVTVNSRAWGADVILELDERRHRRLLDQKGQETNARYRDHSSSLKKTPKKRTSTYS